VQAAPLPVNEPERLAALRGYEILDTLPEPEYDDITYLASQICAAPIAMISLVDRDRQWYKAKVGVAVSETPRDVAFCAHAILEPDDLLVVPDALQDTRFADNPLVTAEPHIRFYAGAPLVTAGGACLGTLCVIDRVPRQLTDEQRRALRALSRQVMAVLDLRAALAHQARSAEERRLYQVRLETYQRELEATNAQLAQQAVTDNLTGLMNRRAFERVLETEIERALRYAAPLSLALVDVDHFKAYNDTFGHLGGDEVLKRIAGLLARNSRSSDAVARIGGEEFAIILPSTPAANAYVQAQRFREAVERARWEPRPMTVSVGLCTHTSTIKTRSDFMRLADRALYASKESGRNRVSTIPPSA
jgi:diguanylate cyclase (GGDEF)-like protein